MNTQHRPKLAAKARLRFDRHTDSWLLLYPERGMALSASASAILQLCDGARTVSAVIDELAVQFEAADRGVLEGDVVAFLSSMIERGLVELEP